MTLLLRNTHTSAPQILTSICSIIRDKLLEKIQNLNYCELPNRLSLLICAVAPITTQQQPRWIKEGKLNSRSFARHITDPRKRDHLKIYGRSFSQDHECVLMYRKIDSIRFNNRYWSRAPDRVRTTYRATYYHSPRATS